MEENPFPNTEIADWSFLDTSPRSKCEKCQKSRKYYCYTCFIALPCIASQLPKVKLPVKVDIIKHPMEIDGKSTSPHAVILSPDDVTVHTYPCIPDYDRNKVLLVFPSANSKTLEEISSSALQTSDPVEEVLLQSTPNSTKLSNTMSGTEILGGGDDHIAGDSDKNVLYDDSNNSSQVRKRQFCDVETGSKGEKDNDENDSRPLKQFQSKTLMNFNRVIFIDSTWNQCHTIVNDERLKDLQQVELTSRTSNFWRCQEGKPKTFLSTIEAIYYFMRDTHQLYLSDNYHHEYDNLLFFFCHQYSKIRLASNGGKGIKSYDRK